MSGNKEPWYAVAISIVFPGAGQLYLGRKLLGYLFLAVYAANMINNYVQGVAYMEQFSDFSELDPELIEKPGSSALSLIYFIVWIWSLFDSWHFGQKANDENFEKSRKSQKDPWIAVILSYLPGLGHIYLGRWLVGIFVFLAFLAVALAIGTTLLFMLFTQIGESNSVSFSGLPYLIVVLVFNFFLIAIYYHTYRCCEVDREKHLRLFQIYAALLILSTVIHTLSASSMNIENILSPEKFAEINAKFSGQ